MAGFCDRTEHTERPWSTNPVSFVHCLYKWVRLVKPMKPGHPKNTVNSSCPSSLEREEVGAPDGLLTSGVGRV